MKTSRFFSLSAYNLLVMLTLLIAVLTIVFSIRAIRSHPPTHWWHAGLGVLGLLLIAVTIAWVTDQNSGLLAAWNGRLAMARMREGLAEQSTLEDKMTYVMEEGDLPGASVGIILDDELVWTATLGEGITEDTVFNIGSIAKPVIATAVLQLVEDDVIDLDADVGDYLPFDVRHPGYPQVPITTRMLLMHKSCLGGYFSPKFGLNTTTTTLEQLAQDHPICRGWKNFELGMRSI